MSSQQRWLAASVWYFISFVPFAATSLWWAAMSNPAPTIRWVVLGIIGAALGASGFIALGETLRPVNARSDAAQAVTSPPQIGDNNTLLNTPVPPGLGSGNTIIGPNLPGGNTIYNQGGTAIGAGACADSTSIAIGAGANAGECAKKP